MRIYGHLPGYLHRWRLLGCRRFMLRLHAILDVDRTPFLHTPLRLPLDRALGWL